MRCPRERCFVSRRRLRVRLRIFDAQARSEAWSGFVSSQPAETRCNIKAHAIGKGAGGFFATLFAAVLMGVAADAVKGTYPAAPPLVPQVGTVLVHLAQHAAGQPKMVRAPEAAPTWRLPRTRR